VAAPPEVLRMVAGQEESYRSTPSPLSASTYSGRVLALPSRAWRSLICSMLNITHTLSHMKPKGQAAQLPERRGSTWSKTPGDFSR